ncbi:hypothetical protein SB778_32175 [Paraburkholderia sp. SIMBA_050]
MKASPEEVTRHNDVTRRIIVGIICEKMGWCVPGHAIAAATDIMEMLAHRGYEPQIRELNRLANGKRV